jgi:DNA processing protein
MIGREGTPVQRRLPELLALTEMLSPYLAGGAQRLAEAMTEAETVDRLLDGSAPLSDEEWIAVGRARVRSERVEHWRRELDRLETERVTVATLFDDAYPANLRLVHNRPPVLFIRGSIQHADSRGVAVVGARSASDAGLEAARSLADQLARRAVTVISGMARGIDTAAHAGALNAGGRTIAVFGTGIDQIHPRANYMLARSIERQGAVLSQFWPWQRGDRWTFPVRNVVTSGLSLGTVVVEASETSGAHLQALDAQRHGKRLFLMRSLVLRQPWAREISSRPGVTVVDGVDDVVAAVDVDLLLYESELVV